MTSGRGRLERPLGILVAIHGGVLLAAAIGKVVAWEPTGAALSRLGCERECAPTAVLAIAAVESFLAGALWFAPRWRWSLIAAAAFSGLLLVVQAWMWRRGVECGCFGPVTIGLPLRSTLTGVGLCACLGLLWITGGRRNGSAPGRLASAAIGILVLSVVLFGWTRRASDDPSRAALRAWLAAGAGSPMLLLVGEPGCSRCEAEMRAAESAQDSHRTLVFVVPEDSRTAREGWIVLPTPSADWWSLAGLHPPAVWEQDSGSIRLRASPALQGLAAQRPPR